MVAKRKKGMLGWPSWRGVLAATATMVLLGFMIVLPGSFGYHEVNDLRDHATTHSIGRTLFEIVVGKIQFQPLAIIELAST